MCIVRSLGLLRTPLRTLSGQTVEVFHVSENRRRLSRLALGAPTMKQFYQALVSMNTGGCHVYPNAGLPNATDGYYEHPAVFSDNMF